MSNAQTIDLKSEIVRLRMKAEKVSDEEKVMLNDIFGGIEIKNKEELISVMKRFLERNFDGNYCNSDDEMWFIGKDDVMKNGGMVKYGMGWISDIVVKCKVVFVWDMSKGGSEYGVEREDKMVEMENFRLGDLLDVYDEGMYRYDDMELLDDGKIRLKSCFECGMY